MHHRAEGIMHIGRCIRPDSFTMETLGARATGKHRAATFAYYDSFKSFKDTEIKEEKQIQIQTYLTSDMRLGKILEI